MHFSIKLIFSGMLSAAASLGLIHLWDVHGGLTPIDKYLYTSEEYIKVNIYLSIYVYINNIIVNVIKYFLQHIFIFRLVLFWL